MRTSLILGFALLVGGVAQATVVDFEGFRIRNNNGTITAPWDSDLTITENAAGDGFAAMTPRSGQKVGYGTNAFNGFQVNQLNTVDWDKISGAANVSYLNIWVTDGTNYAVISSENDYRGTNFGTREEWKIFEYGPSNTNFDWLFAAGTGGRDGAQYLTNSLSPGSNRVTLAELANNITVFSGPVGPTTGVGSGAPRGGFGFNLIYGDTQSNFVGAYHLENLTVEWNGQNYEAGNLPIPEPATMTLLGLGLAGLVARGRRNRS